MSADREIIIHEVPQDDQRQPSLSEVSTTKRQSYQNCPFVLRANKNFNFFAQPYSTSYVVMSGQIQKSLQLL